MEVSYVCISTVCSWEKWHQSRSNCGVAGVESHIEPDRTPGTLSLCCPGYHYCAFTSWGTRACCDLDLPDVASYWRGYGCKFRPWGKLFWDRSWFFSCLHNISNQATTSSVQTLPNALFTYRRIAIYIVVK